MKRPDIDALFKKSKGKPVSLEIYEETRIIGSMAITMKKSSVIVKNSYDIKIIESKRGFVSWVL